MCVDCPDNGCGGWHWTTPIRLTQFYSKQRGEPIGINGTQGECSVWYGSEAPINIHTGLSNEWGPRDITHAT